MENLIKVFGINKHYETPRIYINGSWVPFEVETVVAGNSLVCCSYFDKDRMPPTQTQYGSSNRYILPSDLSLGQVVDLIIKTPGSMDKPDLNVKAKYIGNVPGPKPCTVYGAKDEFDVPIITSYFMITDNPNA